MTNLSKFDNEKFTAALELFTSETTTLDKVQKISTLLKGYNGKLDKQLKTITELSDKIQKIQSGEVITLSAEALPEKTEEEKKRKKLLLLFIKNWKSLQSEVERIKEIHASGNENLTKTGKTLSNLKGPLGLVTVAAVGIVAIGAFLNSRSVNILVKNNGCRPFEPVTQNAVNLPGLKLPNKTIASGGQGTVVIPGIDLTVDETSPGIISLSALNYSKSFNKPYEIKDIIYDGKSLSGKKTVVKLSNAKTHEVIIRCSSN